MAGNYGKHVNRNTGGNTARVSDIPKLETVQQYENAKPSYNRTLSPMQNLVRYAEDMKTRQALANDYNTVKNAQTQQTLERLGQTDIARGSNSYAVEQAKRGNLLSGILNTIADNEKVGNLTTFLTGSATPAYNEFRRQQDEAMKGTLTNEMQRAGLTQEDIDRWNRQQNNAERQEVLSNYAKTHPVLATLNAFPENIAGSAEGVLDKLTSYVTGNPLEAKPSNAEIYRNAVSSGIDSKLGNFAYGVGNSLGDMLLAQLVTGGLAKGKVGAALMGLEKADPVMNSAIERGLTPTQTLAEGAGSGLTTAITEAIPFGRFAEGGHILGSMAAEGLQEGAEDIADTLLDRLVTSVGGNSEKSEWNQNLLMYRNAGYSEEDAKKAVVVDYLKQLGLDSLAGFISGGAFQGANNIRMGNDILTGKPKVNEQNNVEADTNTASNELPVLRDSRAEEAAIQEQRNAELAQLTEAVAQMQNQQNVPQVNANPEEVVTPKNIRTENIPAIQPTAFNQNQDYFRAWAEEGLLGPNVTPENVTRQDVINANMYEEPMAREDLINALRNYGYDYFGGQALDNNFNSRNTLFELDNNWDISHEFLARGEFSPESFAQAFDEAAKSGEDVSVADVVRRAYEIEGKTPNENIIGGSGNTQYMSPNIGNYIEGATQNTQQTIPQVNRPAEQNSDSRTLKSIKNIANAFLAKVMKTHGQTGEKWNQKQLGIVPANVADMVSRASGGSINIANKYFAIEGGKLWHEMRDHSNPEIEKSRGQIPLNPSDISELVETMYHPDIVENLSDNLKTEQRKTFALIKKAEGYIVLVEAVSGKGKHNIIPEMILHLGNKKMQRFLNGEISIGDILYENSDRKGNIEGNARDIKNRVTAAQLAPNNEAPVHTSETYRRSPLFDPNVSQEEENVKSNGTFEPVSGLTFGTAHITDNYVDIDGYSNRKSEKALLNQLAKAVEPYSKSEAENLRNSVKFNEIVQYPGNQGNNEYILEWENVPGASRNVDADGVDVLLSNREDTYENSSTEEAPANYYVHVRFPIDALNEGYQRNNEQIARDNEGLPEDVANLTEQNVGQALGEELEKLNASHPFKLDLFAEKGGEEELPTLKNEVHTGNYKTSKFATNTFPNSGVMTESEYSEVIPEDIKKYEAVTHEATLNAAEKNIKENGYTGEYNRLLKDNKWDAVDVDTAMMCAMREADNARNAEALGIDPNEAWGREVEIFKKARSQATAGGQMIEAFKKWSAMTPEGKLGQAIAHVNETVKEVKNKNNPESKNGPKIPTAAERYLTDEFMTEFLAKAHQYDGQDVSLLKQARLNAELAHMVNEQIPVKFRQKFTSLWMDNLLASFRTLISRNFGGNIGKAALDQTIVKALSGPIDNFMSRYTGTRTTTGFTKEGLKTYLKGFKEGAGQTLRDYWTSNADPDTKLKVKDLAKEIDVFADANVTNRSGVNETSFKESLDNNRITFKNKALKLYDKVIKFGLAIGDNPFYKATYDQTVQELNTLREQGKLKLPEDITEEEFETWVKAVATAQGLEAVYQDNTDLAEGASDIKNGLAKMSKGYVGFDFLSGASMPFVRTPMNVIKTNLELSPLGIVKNTVNTVKEIRANLEANRSAFDTASFDQRRFVRETSRNIVGLLMFATGLMLKNAGMLTGGYSDDKREAQAQKDAGMQEYAWVSPFSGNQYSIDWLPGIGSSFISASAFDDAFNTPDQDFLDALANGVKAGSASMFEQAALQGLRRLTGADTVSSSSDNISDNVVKTVANTASSAIVPSFVRQSAAALDPYKRNTYGMGGKESVINNAIAGIPFLRQTLEPRIGLNGEPMAQNAGRNGFEKWFDNLVNPAMVTVPSALENPVRDEAMRLYNETKNYTAFQPKIGLSYLNVDGHQATTEEYTQFLQIADSAMNQAATNFIQSEYYQSLSDEDKEKYLGELYSAIQTVERAKFLDLDVKLDGKEKAYAEGGEE